MADVIARFKGDTSDLDTKIKKASQTLMQMESDCRKVGGAFINLDKEQVDFIRSMGQMETGAKSAKGTLAQLTTAFTDMSAVYNRLSEEEKKDEGGKALRASLDELRDRIRDGKKELNGISGEINNNGSLLDQLSGKFGINIKQLGGWGAALAAGKVALDVLKDAFMANESNVDEWGRTVESAEGVYNGFLQALNTGDFSGFFTNIENIVNAARDAYNALDELNTMGGIVGNKQARLQTEMTKQKEIIRKQGKDSDAGKAAQKRLQELEVQMKGAYKETGDLNKDVWTKNVKQKAQEAGITLTPEMWRAFGDDNAMNAIRARAKGHAGGWTGKREALFGFEADTRNAEQKFLDVFTDKFREEKVNPYYRAEYNAYNSAYSTGLADARYTAPKSGSKSKTTTTKQEQPSGPIEMQELKGIDFSAFNSIKGVEGLISMYQKTYKESDTRSGREYAENMITSMKQQLELLSGDNPFEDIIKNIELPDVNGLIKPLEDLPEIGKDTAAAWSAASSAISSIGSALMSIDDPAAKVAGTVAQAIASVALAAGQAMAAKDTTASGWAWIGAAASITATMVSTIAAIKSATAGSFANGGVIGGNSYEGDRLYARVNSGETILNSGQAGALNRALDSVKPNAMQSGATSYVSGEQIISVINATGKRKHKGEMIFG